LNCSTGKLNRQLVDFPLLLLRKTINRNKQKQTNATITRSFPRSSHFPSEV